LRRIFSLGKPPGRLVFKGGTSLSKVYGAIERFSEDVDLAFERADSGFTGDNDPATASSRKQRQRALKDLKATCGDLVRGTFRTQLVDLFSTSLRDDGGTWSFELDEADPLTLNFAYPRIAEDESVTAYVKPAVRLEFGARSDHWPAEDAEVMPYVAEVFPSEVPDSRSTVRVLSGARTFWEKATILHQWCHAPEDRRFPDRQSRHFYDLACLAEHELGTKALADVALLERVAIHKEVFFEARWARYDLARPGSLKLVPGAGRLPALEEDYAKMGEMIFGDVPSMQRILETLRSLEERINGSSSSH